MPHSSERLSYAQVLRLRQGDQQRWNRIARALAWAVGQMMLPHVAEDDRYLIEPDRLVLQVPGYDPEVK